MSTYEALFAPDLSQVETIPLERRTYPRHRALQAARCNHCSEPGLLLKLVVTVTHEGGIVACCKHCAFMHHGVPMDCFARLGAELSA